MTADQRRLAALFLALAGYAALLLLSIALLSGDVVGDGLSKLLVALMPVPAGVVLVVISIRAFLASDELQQRLQLVALAVSFLGTLLVTFSWGFLEGVGVAPLGGFAVFAVLVVLYGVGLLAARWRYR